jgi:hypothetical protein
MDHDALAQRFKLEITVLSNNRCREIIFKPPDQHGKQERSVVMWSRRSDLADNVHIDESLSGELRVVKRVALRESTGTQFELSVMGLVRTKYVRITGYYHQGLHRY